MVTSMIHMSRHKLAKTPFLKLETASAIIEKGSCANRLKEEVKKSKMSVKNMTGPQIPYVHDEFENFEDDFAFSTNIVPINQTPKAAVSAEKLATTQCSSIAASMAHYKSKLMKERVAKIRSSRGNTVHNRLENAMVMQKRKVIINKD